MTEECLICGAPLEYLGEDTQLECVLCHKKERAKTRCTEGHYVCDECHEKGIDAIFGYCLSCRSKDPLKILEGMMSLPFCHMHGPEHHIMVGAALLTAYRNSGAGLELERALQEMKSRGQSVPGGACGFWGACGAGISAGIFVSIATGSTPMAEEAYGLSNQMTSAVLAEIGRIGGPRCCKRNGYIAVLTAIEFCAEKLGVKMEKSGVVCTHSGENAQCIGARCPFCKSAG